VDATITVAELPASRGAGWLADAFRIFRRAPLAWIGLCAGWIAITVGLILIPFLGIVIANLLQPAFFASFAICAYRASAGEPFTAADLFAGFKRNMRALLHVGTVLLVAELAISILMVVLGLPVLKGGEQITVEEYANALQANLWIVAVGLVLTALVRGALWFAPPLISFHGMGAMQAMRWSLYAAIANLGTMILYALVLFAIFFLAMLPYAAGLVLVVPLMAISTYVGYRDVFEPKPQ
jgi:hypothetical protein